LKTAVITGASGGLGLAVSRRLAERGYRLLLCCRKRTAGIADLAKDTGGAAVAADFTRPRGIAAVERELEKRDCGVAVYVSCAGYAPEALLPRTGEDLWDAVMDANLTGPVALFRRLIPRLAADRGHGIFVLSHGGRHGRAGLSAYSAAKAALEGFVVSSSRELGKMGIRVNGITPGFMLTRMTKSSSGRSRGRALREHPLMCYSDPADVARFIETLLELPAVTGQVFPLEGRIG